MNGRRVAVSLAVCVAFVVSLSGPGQAQQSAAQPVQEQTPRQVFRSGTTVVPIDVRVLDRNGKPITDLTAADFKVFENKQPQKLDYFSANRITPAEPETSVSIRHAASQPVGLTPQNRRIFLIVLGRGRLQEPSKGLDATLRFIRERLMPQDQVAIMAWNRSTDFTTDHQKAADVVERFRRSHQEIELLMLQHFGGLTALYGGSQIPPAIQRAIDVVFGGPSGSSSRQILPNRPSMTQAEDDARRTLNALLSPDGMTRSDVFRLWGNDVTLANGMLDPTLGMTFDQYVALNRQTMQDVGNLYAGIEYLRYIDGEKHLIFVTEHGFRLPRSEHDRDVGTVAADARVALDTIQTGGVNTIGEGANIAVVGGFELSALRYVSELSGGQVAVSKSAESAYDRILSSTEFGYLLGYTPQIPPRDDGRPRDIRVEVSRRGATISYRRAYIPRSDAQTFDPRQSLATSRLASAASYGTEVFDLRFNTKLTDTRDGSARAVDVELTIDATRLGLARVGDQYVAALNFAIFCGDYYDKTIGEKWESKDLLIPASRLEEVRKTGLSVTVRVPVTQPPTSVKIIVYDYGSDRMGSQVKRMR